MMAFINDLIGTQSILAVFLVIGLGYVVGQINVLGLSLGVGAVLFVGLFIGAIAPKAQIAGPFGSIGLVMFLYGIGILYGRQGRKSIPILRSVLRQQSRARNRAPDGHRSGRSQNSCSYPTPTGSLSHP
jgi:Na+/H+ antiporter NhaB